jgi:enoyl-CoA hydratase/carnithine racemase
MTITLKIEPPLAIITIDRAEARNPLGLSGDGALMESHCAAINANVAVRCTILTGAGAAFSAGGDVKAMAEKRGGFAGSPAEIEAYYTNEIHRLLRALDALETPLVAAVNGPAVGLGCDVTCLADIRIAAESAKFAVSFLKLGIIPGDGGAWLLPRVIGEERAARLLFTGDTIDAATALAWGLCSQIAPQAALMDEARALALRIAALAPRALRETKKLLRLGRTASYDEMLKRSAAVQAQMHPTRDHAEGMAALLEKRQPVFRGE